MMKPTTVAMMKLTAVLDAPGGASAAAKATGIAHATTLKQLAAGVVRSPRAHTVAALTALGIQPGDWFTPAVPEDCDPSGQPVATAPAIDPALLQPLTGTAR